MKNVEKYSLQGESIRRQGWTAKLGAWTMGAALSAALLTPTLASASHEWYWQRHRERPPTTESFITHFELLKFLVEQAGDQSYFGPFARFQDYEKWAKDKMKIKPKGGWKDANTPVTIDFYGEVLVEFFRIKPEKLGKDFLRILEREGIFIDADGRLIDRQELLSVIDDFGYQSRLAVFAHGICSPVVGKKHKFTVKACTPPPTPKRGLKPRGGPDQL